MVDGALWRLRTGAPWPDLAELSGPWQAVLVRFTRWEADGTWARRLKHVQVRNDAVGLCGPSPSTPRPTGFTSTPPARKKRRRGRGRTGSRSRGGLTTKVHLAVDGRGLSSSIVLTPGNANDTTAFGQVLDGIRVRRTDTRRAHDTDPSPGRQCLLQPDQKANRQRRGRLGGRPPAFEKEVYRDRNVVERCFARLKQFRAIATRFDKLADRYRAGVILASLVLWLHEPAR
ncbi:IS5 family transposase [Streptomyces sp. NPDC001591]|uniref:IS5 family transposase n=1 Tax=Streptomyces sp. NPDC001591 TaxID=3364589 RepID=UPI00368B1DB1